MAVPNMEKVVTPSIRLRLAGVWADNDEIMAGLPAGFRIVAGEGLEQWLESPDGRRIEYSCSPRDVEFLAMFKQRCSPVPPAEERKVIEGHSGVVSIEGPGGSTPRSSSSSSSAPTRPIRASRTTCSCEGGAVWRLKEEPFDRFPPGHPQHNPYGCRHFIPVENPPTEMRGV